MCEAETSAWWADPFLAHQGSPKSVVPMSVAFPVLAEGAEAEEVSFFLGVVAAGESGIRGAETWQINRSGTQIGESASCGKIQAYPRSWLTMGRDHSIVWRGGPSILLMALHLIAQGNNGEALQ